MPVPEFLFHASCDHHDFRYWKGGTEADREAADHDFLDAMLIDAGNDPAMQAAAFAYWMAVRLFGGYCFRYADKERDENDLAEIMAEFEAGNMELSPCH